MKLYHGSKDWFQRPSEHFAGVGDGRSMAGLGFYFGTSQRVCAEHLNNRLNDFGQNPDFNAIVYEAELAEDAGVLPYIGAVDRDLISRAQQLATKLGDDEVAKGFATMGRGMDTGQQVTGVTIGDRTMPDIKDGKVCASDFRRLIEEAYPDQRLQNQFYKACGIHVLESYEALCVIDYSKIGPLKVAEVIGNGPEDMPEGTKAGDLTNPTPKIDTSEQLAKGKLYSETFSWAYGEIKATGNPTLLADFRQLADVLVSDRFIPADQFRQTREQNSGFAIRDGMGHAISRILRDGGLESDDRDNGINTWQRQSDWVEDEFGPDNPVTPLISRLRYSIDLHNRDKAEVTEKLEEGTVATAELFRLYNPDDYPQSLRDGLEAIRATGDAEAVLAGRRIVNDLRQMENDGQKFTAASNIGDGLKAMAAGQEGAADKLRHDARISRSSRAEDMVMASSYLDRSFKTHRRLEAQKAQRAEQQMRVSREA